jgi:hypothetical protein
LFISRAISLGAVMYFGFFLSNHATVAEHVHTAVGPIASYKIPPVPDYLPIVSRSEAAAVQMLERRYYASPRNSLDGTSLDNRAADPWAEYHKTAVLVACALTHVVLPR